MNTTTLAPSYVPKPVFRFSFRNHTEHRSTTEPRFVGSDWTELSRSGTIQRWLSGADGGDIVITVPTGSIRGTGPSRDDRAGRATAG